METAEDREPHPVVRLLLDRMASNPEEFSTFIPNGARWGRILTEVTRWAPKEDRDAIEEAQRAIILEKLHGQMMEELLNPAPEPGVRFDTTLVSSGQTGTQAAHAALNAKQAAMQHSVYQRYPQNQQTGHSALGATPQAGNNGLLGGILKGVFK